MTTWSCEFCNGSCRFPCCSCRFGAGLACDDCCDCIVGSQSLHGSSSRIRSDKSTTQHHTTPPNTTSRPPPATRSCFFHFFASFFRCRRQQNFLSDRCRDAEKRISVEHGNVHLTTCYFVLRLGLFSARREAL